MLTTATPATRWTCWFRPSRRHSWRMVGEAATEDDAWTILLAHKAPGDRTVARPGIDPNHPEQRRRSLR
jgi:hypothetical protein